MSYFPPIFCKKYPVVLCKYEKYNGQLKTRAVGSDSCCKAGLQSSQNDDSHFVLRAVGSDQMSCKLKTTNPSLQTRGRGLVFIFRLITCQPTDHITGALHLRISIYDYFYKYSRCSAPDPPTFSPS